MNTSENIAIEIAKIALKDIKMWDPKMEDPDRRFFEENNKNYWLVSFGYLADEFGRDLHGKSNIQIMVRIDDETQKAIHIVSRGGAIFLDQDENGKYIERKRPQPIPKNRKIKRTGWK